MKKAFLIALLFFVSASTTVFSQSYIRTMEYLRGRSFVEGDYTRTAGFEPSLVVAFDFQKDSGHGITMGYKLAPDQHAFNLAYRFALFNAGKGWFYVENRYLYRLFPAYSLQEFNGMLSFGYHNTHWNFKLGLCNRYIAEVPLRLDGGMGTIFEPLNVVFDMNYHLFGEEHSWNIGLGISNQREFIIERVTLFYYTLDGYYNINNKWRLLGEAGLHPAGVLNLSSQYNGYFINLGFTYYY